MELDKLLKTRHSVRKYKQAIPSINLVEKLIDAAVLAPSSCNLQLWEFIYVKDKEKLKKMAKHVTGKLNWAPACIVLAYDPRINYERNAGLVSLGMAAENIMLKALDLGLATCPMAGFKGDEYLKTLLKIPKDYEIALILLLGYPDEEVKDRFFSKTQEVLHIEEFKELRPKLNKSPYLKDWSEEAVLEYRKRIFSVYLWRFKLKFFDTENVERIWNKIMSVLSFKKGAKSLYVYPWDDDFIPKIKTVSDLHLWDSNGEVLSHYSEKYKLEPQKYDKGKYDYIFLLNKLEFEKNPSVLLKKLHSMLKDDGKLIISIFDKRSIYIRAIRLAFLIKYFPDVYHKNPFYKWGPLKFYTKAQAKKLLSKAGFKSVSSQPIRLNLTQKMLKILFNRGGEAELIIAEKEKHSL